MWERVEQGVGGKLWLRSSVDHDPLIRKIVWNCPKLFFEDDVSLYGFTDDARGT